MLCPSPHHLQCRMHLVQLPPVGNLYWWCWRWPAAKISHPQNLLTTEQKTLRPACWCMHILVHVNSYMYMYLYSSRLGIQCPAHSLRPSLRHDYGGVCKDGEKWKCLKAMLMRDNYRDTFCFCPCRLILEGTKVGPPTGSWWHLQSIGQQMLRPKSELSG